MIPTPEDRARALVDEWREHFRPQRELVISVAAALRAAEREAVEGCAKHLRSVQTLCADVMVMVDGYEHGGIDPEGAAARAQRKVVRDLAVQIYGNIKQAEAIRARLAEESKRT